eukprot:691668-Rhodomonas_salina.2
MAGWLVGCLSVVLSSRAHSSMLTSAHCIISLVMDVSDTGKTTRLAPQTSPHDPRKWRQIFLEIDTTRASQ